MVKKVTDKLLIVLLNRMQSNQVQTTELPVADWESVSSSLEEHVREVAEQVDARRHVFYENEISEIDAWSKTRFIKYLQEGDALGQRIEHAVQNGFKKGYGRVVLVSTDCPQLSATDIQKAFDLLNKKHVVLGPKSDGTIYLIGFSVPCLHIFEDKPWGSVELFKKLYLDILKDGRSIALLEEKSHKGLGEFLWNKMKNEEI